MLMLVMKVCLPVCHQEGNKQAAIIPLIYNQVHYD
jgi:hypothetical protein